MFTSFTPDQIKQFMTLGYVAIPDFWNAHEVAAMQAELEGSVRLARIQRQVLQSRRRVLVSRKIDPARLAFWQPPGRHIRRWRKAHKL